MTDLHRPLGQDDASLFWGDTAGRLSEFRRPDARLVDEPDLDTAQSVAPGGRAGPWRDLTVGVIANPASHRNQRLDAAAFAQPARIEGARLLRELPRSHEDLAATLRRFAAEQVDLIVISGGDGTVRDVVTAGREIFADGLPMLAVVPSGKTNAIAIDLGTPDTWSIGDAVAAARRGLVKLRRPLEVIRGDDGTRIAGFIFGAGAFVRATEQAQRTHAAGAYNGVAVGLSLGWAILQTLFAGANNGWRRGEDMAFRLPDGREQRRQVYLLLASTLKRLPLGIKPFGRVRDGLKLLQVDAPPRRMLLSLPAILGGREDAALEANGYHRRDLAAVQVTVPGGFILDGELYAGGTLTLRESEPVRFVAP